MQSPHPANGPPRARTGRAATALYRARARAFASACAHGTSPITRVRPRQRRRLSMGPARAGRRRGGALGAVTLSRSIRSTRSASVARSALRRTRTASLRVIAMAERPAPEATAAERSSKIAQRSPEIAQSGGGSARTYRSPHAARTALGAPRPAARRGRRPAPHGRAGRTSATGEDEPQDKTRQDKTRQDKTLFREGGACEAGGQPAGRT